MSGNSKLNGTIFMVNSSGTQGARLVLIIRHGLKVTPYSYSVKCCLILLLLLLLSPFH